MIITKVLDGVFFFLVFKACQAIWDRVVTKERLDIIESRLDWIEDKLHMILEGSQ